MPAIDINKLKTKEANTKRKYRKKIRAIRMRNKTREAKAFRESIRKQTLTKSNKNKSRIGFAPFVAEFPSNAVYYNNEIVIFNDEIVVYNQ